MWLVTRYEDVLAIFKVERFVKDWRKVLTPEQLARIPQVIPRGEMVRVVIAAADCDPERFPDPDALDITRTANRHLAFGKGIHHCLGAPLARMEGQIAIRRMPALRLQEPPESMSWRPGMVMRGLQNLPVEEF